MAGAEHAESVQKSRIRSESTPLSVNDGKPKKMETGTLTKKGRSNSTNLGPAQNTRRHAKRHFYDKRFDEELKAFFDMAGVTEDDLNDNDTRNFIYNFIENHGGIECAKQEIAQIRAGSSKYCSINLRRPEENRTIQVSKETHLKHKLKEPRKDLASSKDESKFTENNLLHKENVSKGSEKKKIPWEVGKGSTKRRVSI